MHNDNDEQLLQAVHEMLIQALVELAVEQPIPPAPVPTCRPVGNFLCPHPRRTDIGSHKKASRSRCSVRTGAPR